MLFIILIIWKTKIIIGEIPESIIGYKIFHVIYRMNLIFLPPKLIMLKALKIKYGYFQDPIFKSFLYICHCV